MKSFKLSVLTFILILLLAVSSYADMELLYEDCEDISDWTIVDAGDNTAPITWTNTDPGNNSLANSTGAFLSIDSDYAGSGTVTHSTITSQVIDCSGAPNAYLSFIHYYNYYSGDWGEVRVISSTDTTVLGTFNADTNNGDTVEYDMSAYAVGDANVQIVFEYYGSWAYYWLIDDITVYMQTPPKPDDWVDVYGDIEGDFGGTDYTLGDVTTALADADEDGIWETNLMATATTSGTYQIVACTYFWNADSLMWDSTLTYYPSDGTMNIEYGLGDFVTFYWNTNSYSGAVPNSVWYPVISQYDTKVLAGSPTYNVIGSFNGYDATINALFDDGTNGDAVAADGEYTAQIIFDETNYGNIDFRIAVNGDTTYQIGLNSYGSPTNVDIASVLPGDMVKFFAYPETGKLGYWLWTTLSEGDVLISEFHPKGSSTANDWVELYCVADSMNLKHLSIVTSGDTIIIDTADNWIYAGEYVIVDTSLTGSEYNWLDNYNDSISLVAYDVLEFDYVDYGQGFSGCPVSIYEWSTSRDAVNTDTDDMVWDWNLDSTPTYGVVNDPGSVSLGNGTVFFNEIDAWESGTDDSEFIELYNSGVDSVDISGWFIVDGSGDYYTIPDSTVLLAGEWFVLDDLDFPAYMNIYDDYDGIYLFDSAMNRIDQVGWTSDRGDDTSIAAILDGNRSVFDGYTDETTTDMLNLSPTTPGDWNVAPYTLGVEWNAEYPITNTVFTKTALDNGTYALIVKEIDLTTPTVSVYEGSPTTAIPTDYSDEVNFFDVTDKAGDFFFEFDKVTNNSFEFLVVRVDSATGEDINGLAYTDSLDCLLENDIFDVLFVGTASDTPYTLTFDMSEIGLYWSAWSDAGNLYKTSEPHSIFKSSKGGYDTEWYRNNLPVDGEGIFLFITGEADTSVGNYIVNGYIGDVQSPAIDHTPIGSSPDTSARQASATITDDYSGVDFVELYYSVDSAAYEMIPMNLVVAAYIGEIPGQAEGSTVEYYILSQDVAGNCDSTIVYSYYVGIMDEEIIYDDGTDEAAVGGVPTAFANDYTPSFPAGSILMVRYLGAGSSGTPGPMIPQITSEATKSPSTTVGDIYNGSEITLSELTWYDLDLSGENITFNGTVWIGYFADASYLHPLAYDNSNGNAHTMALDTGVWYMLTDLSATLTFDAMIRAVFASGTGVELASFAATSNENHILVSWKDDGILGNNLAGYEVFRSTTREGKYTSLMNGTELLYSKDGRYTFKDHNVESGTTYYYKVAATEHNGCQCMFGPTFCTVNFPQTFELAQNYPNPFNPATDIRYSLPTNGKAELNIYNVNGQLVRALVDDNKEAGHHIAHWDGCDDNGNSVSSGIYFYRLNAGEYQETKKMIMLK